MKAVAILFLVLKPLQPVSSLVFWNTVIYKFLKN